LCNKAIPNYNNAAALIRNNKRILAYDPLWFKALNNKTGSQWSAITIMAHEVGHHLNGHPLTNVNNQESIKNELAADYFSGLTIQRMGGSLENAQQWIKLYGTEKDTISHPSSAKRFQAIKLGWNFGCSLSNCNNISQQVIMQYPATSQLWSLNTLNNAQWTKDLGSGLSPVYAKTEVLLARHNVSTGAIRGDRRINLMKAISAFQQMNGLQPTGALNTETWEALNKGKTEDAYISYTITKEDINYPYLSTIPRDFISQSKMKGFFYTRVSEMLSEKFHMDEEFLKRLNPHTTFTTIGEKVIVANTRNTISLTEPISLLIAHKSSKILFAFNSDNQMIAAFPASYGSVDTPSPSGTEKISKITPNPIYNTDLEPYFPEKLKGFLLPAGPNSIIGMMLISFENRGFGIHGTPNPSAISLTTSGGEIRLTNWDVINLSKQLQPGVIIKFVE
jgi:lipoprotein-anchoring transpeptidase ErfK/SrfK